MAKKLKQQTFNGNEAAAYVAFNMSEAAGIYPITPSSDMAEYCDMWAAKGMKNIFGTTPRVIQMQSEAGAAGTVHGLAAAGALSTTFTASQGLLMKIPNMYKIAGELLPCVIHVSARTLATHALSIFGDHSDIYSTRATGFAMLSSNSVQEAQDMALVAHLSTIEASYPFLHFFDGFRTSHEFTKIDVIEPEDMKKLVNMKKIHEFKQRGLNPNHPHQSGTAQNPDTFFQNREACNNHIANVFPIVEKYMESVGKLVGKNYKPFEYVGHPNAEYVTIAMGSACETIEETIEKLNANGAKYGLVKVRLYRPFNTCALIDALPKSTKVLTILDRTKENGANDPLYLDVTSALFEHKISNVKVLAGRYGLSSKEFNPNMVATIYSTMRDTITQNLVVRSKFTVGINDDITNTSLEIRDFPELVEDGGYVFYGLGSDGTVSANKNTSYIVGDNSNLYAQAYFVYDSKKSGSTTTSHLRFSKKPIKSAYLVKAPIFVACHNQSFLNRFDMLGGMKHGGTFLLNTTYSGKELEKILPPQVKKILADKQINFYTLNAYKLAQEIGLGYRINTIMQSAFFKLSSVIPYDKAKQLMKDAAKKSYGKKGDAILQMNYAAIDAADSELVKIEIPSSWSSLIKSSFTDKPTKDKYYNEFCHKVNTLRGNELPVSAFSPDGRVPTATSQYEKRNIATALPKWIEKNCIQCNHCVYVCPHATIRAHLLDDKQLASTPENFPTLKAIGFPDKHYRIQLNQEDCTGCGVCAKVCPSREKALEMVDFDQISEHKNYEFTKTLPYPDLEPTNVKNSQFLEPYFEFSGACGGCGQTPYIKLITQLFGRRMVIANATGCTSIYGGSSPCVPYSKDKDGRGPAWANSLFEDNAEFGYGIRIAHDARRTEVKTMVEDLLSSTKDKDVRSACERYLGTFDYPKANDSASTLLVETLKSKKVGKDITDRADALDSKSVWIIGGDGWAYDIGFGGLDHVAANNENVNILVLDTEVYSNTGGQQSKATPAGAIAKFAAGGKPTNKKDLGLMMMNYDNVYVAQIAMGANYQQTLNAIREAEAHNGPSIIIAYATCIGHGIDMSESQTIMKNAVNAGYWTLYRRNPETGLVLDSKAPSTDFKTFLRNETRYKSLEKANPEAASQLFDIAEQNAHKQFEKLQKLAEKEKS